MKIFALETDASAIHTRSLSQGERELMTVYHHAFLFLIKLVKSIFWTVLLVSLSIALLVTGVPQEGVLGPAAIVWLLFIFAPLFVSYIDWQYDFVIVTTDKVIIVDQSFIFRQRVIEMNLDNFASVTADTQFWDLFPFGVVRFDLKEGVGDQIVLRYVPSARTVAKVIADAVTAYERRKQVTPVVPSPIAPSPES